MVFCRDDPSQGVLPGEGKHFLDLLETQIGSDLDEHRARGGQRTVLGLDGAQERVEFVPALEGAQAGGVRRGNVEHEIIAVRVQFFEGFDVVLGGAF